MTRQEYSNWHIGYCGEKPSDYLLDKYYPKPEPDYREATERDWESFWEESA